MNVNTTNNRMELKSAIEALHSLENYFNDTSEDVQKFTNIVVLADSQYVVRGITEWIQGWIRKNWRTVDKKPVLNQDLWKKLLPITESLSKKGNVVWKTINGHSGIVGNERADEIATRFADGEKVELYEGSLDKYPFTDILKDVPLQIL